MTSSGRNLATNSKLMDISPAKNTMNVGLHSGSRITRDDGFVEIRTSRAWHGVAVYANLTEPQVGETFTFSCDARNDSEQDTFVSLFMLCFNSAGTRVYPPFQSGWIGSSDLEAGEERRVGYKVAWTQEAIDLLANGGSIRYTMQSHDENALAFWKPKLERGSEMTEYRQAPEDLVGPSDMILATDTETLAVAVDVQQVDTYYYQTASTGTAPSKPTAASPSGWQTTEYAFDASKAVWSCQKTTLTDGTFYWGAVSKWSAYEGSVVAWNKANAAQESVDNLEVGGRNLLRGSAKLGTSGSVHGWVNNGGVPSLDTVDGVECIKVTSTTANAYIPSARTTSRVNLEWGQTYIASCWLMFNEDINNTFGDSVPLHYHVGSVATTDVFDLAINGKGGGVSTYEIEPDASYGSTIPANTWVRFVRKIVTNATAPNADYPYPVFAPFVFGSLRKSTTSTEHITWIRGFKIEKGNVATDWTPAPEDTEAAIAEAAAVAGNYIVETATNDVWVHSENHGPNSSGVATSDTYGWRIGSVFELVRAGLSYFKMWVENSVAKVRVGLENAGHSVFSPDGMEVYADSSSKVASFGATSTIGKDGKFQLSMAPGSLSLSNDSDETVFSVTENPTESLRVSKLSATFTSSNRPSAAAYGVTDTRTVQGSVSAYIHVDGEFDYDYDLVYGRHYTSSATPGSGASVTLTSLGVEFIELWCEFAKGETTDLYIDYHVEYSFKAIVEVDGEVAVNGEGSMVSLVNDSWSSDNMVGTYVNVRNDATDREIEFGIGSGGYNAGLLDRANSRWIICTDRNGNTVLHGENFDVKGSGKVAAIGNYPAYRLESSLRSTRIGATAPSETQYFNAIQGFDNNGDNVFYSETAYTPSREMYRSFVARRYSSNGATAYSNGFYLGIDNSGDPYVSFTGDSARAWREGLGIGEKKSDELSSSTSLSSGSTKAVASVSLTAGTWIVVGHAVFASNSSGVRSLGIGSTANSLSYTDLSCVTVPPASGADTRLQSTSIVSPTSTTTYYLNAYQNSGSSRNCTSAKLTAIRIA